jgi:hypothetical protein
MNTIVLYSLSDEGASLLLLLVLLKLSKSQTCESKKIVKHIAF